MTNEERAYQIFLQYGRMSAIMLARKFQVSVIEGKRLCDIAWNKYLRNKKKDDKLKFKKT